MNRNNEIVIYWASIPVTTPGIFLNYMSPEPVIKELKKLGSKFIIIPEKNNFLKCPSIINNIKNTFSFSSPIDLKIEWVNKRISTPERNQEFFDSFINARNPDEGFLSSSLFHTVFFTEEPSLIAKQKTAIYSKNDFTRKTGIFEGHFDIGQWFRPLDLAFFFKEEGIVDIKVEDVIFYIEFITDKKIVFKRFIYNDKLVNFHSFCADLKNYRSFSIRNYLETCYMLFNRSNVKKQIIKEIQNNIID